MQIPTKQRCAQHAVIVKKLQVVQQIRNSKLRGKAANSQETHDAISSNLLLLLLMLLLVPLLLLLADELKFGELEQREGLTNSNGFTEICKTKATKTRNSLGAEVCALEGATWCAILWATL